MRKTTTWRMLVALLSLAMILAACSSGEGVDVGETTTTTAAGGTDTTAPATDDETDDTMADPEMVLVAAQGAEPDRLDPHLTSAYASFQVLENVYDTLVQPGPDLQMEPALAESWEISEDNLTWAFTLREGVTFHNGRALTAEDVVYSYNRIMDPDVGAANSFRFASIDSVTAVDDLTVEIVLSRPTPNLLVNIGGFKGMAIIPSEILDDGSIDTFPIGTGPFRFVSQSPDQGIVLEANPDY
ncbi:MAG: ABC transporter substrate-binding protein, partial [Acidimicrobiia bacterium]